MKRVSAHDGLRAGRQDARILILAGAEGLGRPWPDCVAGSQIREASSLKVVGKVVPEWQPISLAAMASPAEIMLWRDVAI